MTRTRIALVVAVFSIMFTLIPSAGAAAKVRIGFAGWNGITPGMKLAAAGEQFGLEVVDSCGGYPALDPRPRGLTIGDPFVGMEPDAVAVVNVIGGSKSNIVGPKGIHPGMKLRKAVSRLGAGAVKVTTDDGLLTSYYLVDDATGRAFFLSKGWTSPRGKFYPGRVGRIAIVPNAETADRLAHWYGC